MREGAGGVADQLLKAGGRGAGFIKQLKHCNKMLFYLFFLFFGFILFYLIYYILFWNRTKIDILEE